MTLPGQAIGAHTLALVDSTVLQDEAERLAQVAAAHKAVARRRAIAKAKARRKGAKATLAAPVEMPEAVRGVNVRAARLGRP